MPIYNIIILMKLDIFNSTVYCNCFIIIIELICTGLRDIFRQGKQYLKDSSIKDALQQLIANYSEHVVTLAITL